MLWRKAVHEVKAERCDGLGRILKASADSRKVRCQCAFEPSWTHTDLWLGTAKPSTLHIYISRKLCLQIITPLYKRDHTALGVWKRGGYNTSLFSNITRLQSIWERLMNVVSMARFSVSIWCTIYTQKWTLAWIWNAIDSFRGVG